jgi:Protein of unknown function (DUF1553)/Protein of unknown function (DUF1549)
MMTIECINIGRFRFAMCGARQLLRVAYCMIVVIHSVSQAQDQEPNLADTKPAVQQFADGRNFEEPPLNESDRDHWSFQPIAKAVIPQVSDTQWSRSGLDTFILEGLETVSLSGAVPAQKAMWLRRVKFDLLGLPPTVEELDDFEADGRPDADSRLVDRLLGSPRYGERWAQHWLDLARFAETDGFEHDKVRENAWQYRDWVIRALNEDMPYDQFITYQVAGDLGTREHPIATMFCLAGADMPDINNQELRRHDRLNELTSTVGAALLGLQLHCAQCHDHKYDPISQADFYRLRAVFEPAVPNLKRDQPFNQFVGSNASVVARFHFRGEWNQQGKRVEADFPRIATIQSQTEQSDFSKESVDARIRFAKWLFDAEQPLVARVIANRLWQHHFGRSLISNPSDLGLVPPEPQQPELIDWLANEMQNHGWSIKRLHRQILLSATYRQTSQRLESDRDWSRRVEVDKENRLYSRFPRHRLEGEAIRDSILAISGLLNQQAYGPSVMPPLPTELTSTLLKGQWKTSENTADHHRRSVYIFARRNLRYPLFEVFDRPDAGASCATRDRSTTAIQSLQMLNSALALECAQALRTRWKEHGKSIEDLFRLVYSRTPTKKEVALLRQFLAQSSESNDGNEVAACLALINASEFIYVD